MNAWIVSFLGVSLVTSLIALVLSFLFNRLKSKVDIRIRYFLWQGLLISLLLPFRPHFGKGLIQVQEASLELPLSEISLMPDQLTEAPTKPNLLSQFFALPWLKILLVIWLIGAIISLGLQLYRSWKFYRLFKRWSQPIEEQRILDSLEGTKELLALTKPIKVSHYHLTPTPMLVGFNNPHILLPSLDYTDEELDLIFEHELTHFKHRDVYVNFLIILVTSLHWFNPLVAFIGRETQETAESYCDYDVLVKQDKAYRTFYGETIISMIGKGRQKTVGLSSCFYSDKFKLKRRMEAIVSTELSVKWLTLLAVGLVASSVLFSGSVFAMVEKTPLVATSPRVLARPDSEELRLRLSELLDVPANELIDWKMSEKANVYVISFNLDGDHYDYHLTKVGGQLKRVNVEEVVSSSSSSSSSTEDKTNSSKTSTESSQATATSSDTTEQEPASSTTTVPAQSTGTPVTTVPQVVETPVQQEVVPQQTYQQPSVPAVTYTPVAPAYDYDDDDYDDYDYDDDDDDD